MNSLSELRDFFLSKKIEIDSYNGHQLKVGRDIWTLIHGVFYLNNNPQSIKNKIFMDNYEREKNGN
jgi:hypothetical protein